jgi:hypothetical protein
MFLTRGCINKIDFLPLFDSKTIPYMQVRAVRPHGKVRMTVSDHIIASLGYADGFSGVQPREFGSLYLDFWATGFLRSNGLSADGRTD